MSLKQKCSTCVCSHAPVTMHEEGVTWKLIYVMATSSKITLKWFVCLELCMSSRICMPFQRRRSVILCEVIFMGMYRSQCKFLLTWVWIWHAYNSVQRYMLYVERYMLYVICLFMIFNLFHFAIVCMPCELKARMCQMNASRLFTDI